MRRLLLIALLPMAVPSHAAMYKCTSSDGRVSYQEMPCASGTSASKVNISAPPRIGSDEEIEAGAEKLRLDKKKLHSAVRAKLDAGDIAGANAIAVSPEDFSLIKAEEDKQRKAAKERADRHARECESKAIDMNRARQDAMNHRGDSWWLNRANAETDKFRAECQ